MKNLEDTIKKYDVELTSTTNLLFTKLTCILRGEGKKTKVLSGTGKSYDVEFDLNKPDPNNCSLCTVTSMFGHARISEIDKRNRMARLETNVNATVSAVTLSKTVNQFVPYEKTPEHVATEFSAYGSKFSMRIRKKK